MFSSLASARAPKSGPKVKPSPKAAPIKAMKPVGNYAYGIAFSDGHDTGIYTLEILRSLGEPVSD